LGRVRTFSKRKKNERRTRKIKIKRSLRINFIAIATITAIITCSSKRQLNVFRTLKSRILIADRTYFKTRF
jgi:hypothetical protein